MAVRSAMATKKIVMRGGVVHDGAVAGVDDSGNTFTRLVADPPGVLFKCECGHIRRVIPEERHFRCENPVARCAFYWSRIGHVIEGEFDPDTLGPKWTDDLDAEGLVQFTSENVLDVIQRTNLERKAKGETLHVQPQGPTSQERAEAKQGADRYFAK